MFSRDDQCPCRHNTKFGKPFSDGITLLIGWRVSFLDMFQAVFWFLLSCLPGLARPACDWFKFVTKFTQLQVRNPRSELTWTKHSCFRAVEYLYCLRFIATHLWFLSNVPTRKTQTWNLNPRNLALTSKKTLYAQLPLRLQTSEELVSAIPTLHNSSKAVFTIWATAMSGSERWCRTFQQTEEWARSRFSSTLSTIFRISSRHWNCRIYNWATL